ncbi:hypothetical protein, partial [Salmonella sp. gx-f7]|uniref:hypothetical protein n=1 Tax=Salmonella sp. gx-f7 TaxID=2582606 RepID=UPI001F412FCB
MLFLQRINIYSFVSLLHCWIIVFSVYQSLAMHWSFCPAGSLNIPPKKQKKVLVLIGNFPLY